MTLKTLQQHQEEKQESNRLTAIANQFPRLNGIECPKCKKELFDSDNMTLTSNPPQKNIHCQSCDYRGYRYF